MQNYELMFIHKIVSADEFNKFICAVKELITRYGGDIKNIDLWGKKKLALAIDDYNEGEYGLIVFSVGHPGILSINKELKAMDDLLRFMLIRMEK